MNSLRLLSAVTTLFSFSLGAAQVAAPQVAVREQWSDGILGLLGACAPLGYAAGCLFCRRFCSRAAPKRLLLFGVGWAAASQAALFFARAPWECALQLGSFGLSNSLFYPVASSWMLDFQAGPLTRTRILRRYNVAWTSGTAAGMYLAGWTCKAGWVYECFLLNAAVLAVALGLACLPRAAPRALAPDPAGDKAGPREEPRSMSRSILWAALLANLLALGTRAVLMNNYAKLNKFQQHGPEDMGLYSALMIFGQLAAFLGGALYEPLLGRRSLYFVLAAALVAANLSFAWTDIRPALAAMALLTGFVLAAAFQSGMVAVTAYFRPVRRGTMFYEFLIGLTGLTSLLGGFLVEVGGAWGCGQVTALRLPMLAMSLCVLLGLAVQLLLVGRRVERRLLLPAARS